MADEEKPKVGYAVTYTADVGNGQQFQIVGNLPVGATLAEFKAEFNKFRDAGEQQRTRSVIPNLREGIKKIEMQIDKTMDALETFEKNSKGRAVASNEKNQKEQLLLTIKHDKMELEHKKKVLAECEAELKD